MDRTRIIGPDVRKNIAFSFLRIVAAFAFFLAAQFAGGVVESILRPHVSVLSLEIAETVSKVVVFLVLLWIYLWLVERRHLDAMGLVGSPPVAAGHFFVGALFGAFAIVATVLPLYLLKVYTLSFSAADWAAGLMGLLFMIGVAFTEELFLRGAVQGALLRLGRLPSLFLTSFLFAGLHLFNPDVSYLAVGNIFLAGVALGMAYYAFGDLWAPVGFHLLWNWVQGSFLGIPVSGLQISGVYVTTVERGPDWLSGGLFGAENTVLSLVVLSLLSLLLFFIAKRSGNWDYFGVLVQEERIKRV